MLVQQDVHCCLKEIYFSGPIVTITVYEADEELRVEIFQRPNTMTGVKSWWLKRQRRADYLLCSSRANEVARCRYANGAAIIEYANELWAVSVAPDGHVTLQQGNGLPWLRGAR